MTVPGRVEAAHLLLSLDPPDWFLRHSRAVGEVAGWLGLRIESRGRAIDRALTESAALLHDVDKLLSASDPARHLPHGEGSAAWLTARGHEELASAVAGHPVTRLGEDRWDGGPPAGSRLEDLVVAYADKRAGQRLGSMNERFATWRRRHPDGWSDAEAQLIRDRADALETIVCAAAGVRPGDVERLPWTGSAIARARDAR